jgi:hypothetical protein
MKESLHLLGFPGAFRLNATVPFTHKDALVAWYAIDRADWQASQAAASQ